MTRRLAALCAAALALVLVGCSSQSQSSNGATGTDRAETSKVIGGTLPADGPAESGGTLTITDPSDAISLDPQKTASVYTHTGLSGVVYSKLLEFKTGRDIPYGSMGLRGDLAESWQYSEDGRTWTFKLRTNVKWQNIAPVNGRAFEARDVVCTIDRIRTLPGVQKNLIDMVASVETPNPSTVVFKLSQPYGAFDDNLASYFMEILPCEGTLGQFDLATTAIGTGPFILKKWERKVQRTYVKNPDYFVAGKPYLDQVNMVVQSDSAAILAAFRTKQIDIASVPDALVPSVKTSDPDAAIRAQLSMIPNQIYMNQAKKPFDDLRVRKAVAMSWDRVGMGNSFATNGFALAGPFPSMVFGAMTSAETAALNPYDPAGAKKLLAEAGYPNGFDTVMTITDGYGAAVVNQAQWVQQDLKDIGINVTLKTLDYATYFSTWQAKDFDIIYSLQTPFLTADEWLNATYLSTGARNWWNTNDPKLDAMIVEQRGIIDRGDREKKLRDISKYIAENVMDPFLGYNAAGAVAQQPYVHNYWGHPALARGYLVDIWLDKSAPTRQ